MRLAKCGQALRRYWVTGSLPVFVMGLVAVLAGSAVAQNTITAAYEEGGRYYAEGEIYAPALKKSAVDKEYYDFYGVVVNGRENGNSVMPHFGENMNVMCYLDDIYVYLKARGMDAVARGRPAKKEPKSEMIAEEENVCMG